MKRIFTVPKGIINIFRQNCNNHTIIFLFSQEKRKAAAFATAQSVKEVQKRLLLLLAEGFAVGTLVHSRILLVGAYQNAVQRAVVFGIAVVSALLNGAFDAFVCLVIHVVVLLLFGFWVSMSVVGEEIQENFSFSCN